MCYAIPARGHTIRIVVSGLATGVIFSDLTSPQGIAFDSANNLLVVERGSGITALTPTATPALGWNRTVTIQDANLTSGIQVDGRPFT